MKANVPKKIYVNFPFGERHPERGPMVTKQGLNAEDVEYTCTDAFIEKACEFLKDHLAGYDICEDDIERSVESFKLAMKL